MRALAVGFAAALLLCSYARPHASNAQGMMEMGGAYAGSATQAGALHGSAGGMAGALNKLYGSPAGMFGGGGGSAGHQGGQMMQYDLRDPTTPSRATNESTRYMNLAVKAEQKGNTAEALKWYSQASAVREQVWPSKDPFCQRIYAKMASIYQKQHNIEAVEECYRRMLSIQAHQVSPGDYSLAPYMEKLANVQYQQKRFNDASGYYTQVVALKEQKFGEEDPTIIPSRLAASRALLKTDSYKDAEPYLKKNMELLDASKDAGSPQLLGTLECYASLLHKTKHESEAEQVEARLQELKAQNEKPAETAGAPTAEEKEPKAATPDASSK